jgi:hypothetical protein
MTHQFISAGFHFQTRSMRSPGALALTRLLAAML